MFLLKHYWKVLSDEDLVLLFDENKSETPNLTTKCIDLDDIQETE